MSNPSAKSIGTQTKLTLGLVIFLGGASIRAAFILGGWMEKIEAGQRDTNSAIEAVRLELSTASSDPWPRKAAASYHETLGLLNPGIVVPPVPRGN